jgi:hypothetical protein
MSDSPEPTNETPAKAPRPKPEKVKEPAVEELPFNEFIPNHYLPALSKAMEKQGITDLTLNFSDRQVQGKWANGLRAVVVYFAKEDINAQKAFACADFGKTPSTIEPFLVDERKSTLDLLVFAVIQRLNAQKWLMPN